MSIYRNSRPYGLTLVDHIIRGDTVTVRQVLEEIAEIESEYEWPGPLAPQREIMGLRHTPQYVNAWFVKLFWEGEDMGGLITAEQRSSALSMDSIIKDTQKEVSEARVSGNAMIEAITVAAAMDKIRTMLDPLMPQLLKVRGTPLGFKTDRDRDCYDPKKDYPVAIMRDALAVGMLNGYLPINNEINVIAGGFYATKNGVARKVKELPGLTDLDLQPSVPVLSQSRDVALVGMVATWKMNGKAYRIECLNDGVDRRICVKNNEHMGIDGLLGKAERKILMRIYKQMTGSELSAGASDDADSDTIQGQVVASSEMAAEEPSAGAEFESAVFALSNCQMQGEIDNVDEAYFGAAAKVQWTPSEREEWGRLREARKVDIKAKRGQRSNSNS